MRTCFSSLTLTEPLKVLKKRGTTFVWEQSGASFIGENGGN